MKKWILPIILTAILALAIFQNKWIANKVADLLEKDPKVVVEKSNLYTKNYDFKFIKQTKEFKPLSYQDLLNIYFTVINNGWERFTFYCPDEYTDWLEDIKKISEDEALLSHINNYTHPFNNYKFIKTTYLENGEVTIELTPLYTKEQINKINARVDEILPDIIKDAADDEEKIMAIHDYIINNTKYDRERNETGNSKYQSNIAYGLFFEGYGLCGAYSDAMAIFLTRLNIKNFKIASEKHVWNAVYINNEWLHLDLTWDDPVSKDGKDNLWHYYLLIKTERFKELDKNNEDDHIFDKSIYLEFK